MRGDTSLDCLVEGARIYPLTEEGARYAVMGISEGKVAYLRETADAGLRARARRIVDLGGKTVLPGFFDTHVHFSGLGIISISLDLRGARSLGEVYERTRTYLASPAYRGGLVAGFGLMDELLAERRLPTRRDLDELCPGVPAILAKGDGHCTVLNTPAMAALRLSAGMPGVEVDPDTGEPTGVMRGPANFSVYAGMGRLFGLARSLAGMVAANNLALAGGVTSVHAAEGLGFPGDSDVRGVLQVAPHLDVRVRLYLQSREVEKARRLGLDCIGACFATAVDGSTTSGTAAFFEPYEGGGDNRGLVYFSQEELDAFVRQAHIAGLQVNLHAIGDRAIDMAITAYEQALAARPRADHRHRIEHCSFPTEAQLDRIARAGIAVSTQPGFLEQPGLDYESTRRSLGEERARRYTPLRDMIRRGITVGGSSDGPVMDIDPLAGVQIAVTHPVAEQRLTVYEALRMFTAGAARIGCADDRRGTLAPGKDADFIVLDTDPFAVPPERIGAIKVERAFIAGRERPPLRLGLPGLAWGMVRRAVGMAGRPDY